MIRCIVFEPYHKHAALCSQLRALSVRDVKRCVSVVRLLAVLIGLVMAGPVGRAETDLPPVVRAQSPGAIERLIAAELKGTGSRARLERVAGQIVLHNNRIAIALLDEAEGMGFANVYHVTRGLGFGAKPESGYGGLIWRLSMRTDRGRGKRFLLTNRSPAQRDAKFVAREDGAALRLSWRGLNLGEEKAVLDVTVTIRLGHDSPQSEWRIEVDSKSRVWSLWEVYFPQLDLGRIGESPEDDFLVIPRAEGRCHRNPIHGWKRGLMTGAGQPHGHRYPGGAQMQFAAYYEKDGGYHYASPRRGGLYLAAEDGQLNVKRFFYTNLQKSGVLRYEMLHYPHDMVTPGSDYEMPFDFVATVFDGDWYDAARIYRRWALEQPWCRRGPFVSRTDIPAWFKQADFFFRADSRTGETTYFRQMCDDALKTLHPPVCCHWYHWMPAGKGVYDLSRYFPPRPGIAEAWKGAAKQGVHIFPYVNAQIWSTHARNYEQALPYTIKDEHGRVVNWSTKDYAQMCRTQAWYRNLLTDVCGRLAKEYEVGGLYLDQLGTAFNGLCLDPSHGHPLGGGNHAVMGARRIFEAVRERVGTRIPVLSEASSEENIDISAGKIIHYNVWPGFVPLFSAVYHDLWSFYGRNVGGPKDDPLGFMNMANIFVIGGQVGRIWPGRLPKALKGEGEPWVREQARFLKRLIEARRAGAKFLRFGEMLRPLEFVGSVPTVPTRLWRDEKRPMPTPAVLPVVVCSVWRAPDGEVGIVVVNLSEKSVDFTGRFSVTEYGLSATNERRPRHVVGQGGHVTVEGGHGTFRTRISARDVQIVGL